MSKRIFSLRVTRPQPYSNYVPFQEVYDAVIARALAVAAAERAERRKLGRVRIFTDAITRMTHDEPGPGQTYLRLQTRTGDSSPAQAGAFC